MGWILGFGIPLAYIVAGFITAKLFFSCYAYPKWLRMVRVKRAVRTAQYSFLLDSSLSDHTWGENNYRFNLYGNIELVVFGGIFWPVVVPGFFIWAFGKRVLMMPFRWVMKTPSPDPMLLHEDDWVTNS